jgi:hypothetical protein
MNLINITLPTKKALSMDAPVIVINSMNISFTHMIIYGLFILLVFIGLIVWLSTFKRGG